MFKAERVGAPTYDTPAEDMQVGDIGEITSSTVSGVFTPGDFIMRIGNDIWVSLKQPRDVWTDGGKPVYYRVRILKKGEQVTLTVQ